MECGVRREEKQGSVRGEWLLINACTKRNRRGGRSVGGSVSVLGERRRLEEERKHSVTRE